MELLLTHPKGQRDKELTRQQGVSGVTEEGDTSPVGMAACVFLLVWGEGMLGSKGSQGAPELGLPDHPGKSTPGTGPTRGPPMSLSQESVACPACAQARAAQLGGLRGGLGSEGRMQPVSSSFPRSPTSAAFY